MYDKLLAFIENNRIMSKIVSKENLPQFIRYLIVGFSTTFLELLLFYLLLEKTSLTSYLSTNLLQSTYVTSIGFNDFNKLKLYISNTMAYIIIFVFNYMLQRKWAFNSRDKVRRQIFLYGALFFFNLFISNKLVAFFHLSLKLHSIVAKVISIAMVVSWNFVIYKKIIFKK